MENKGKLILTEMFPSVQKHDIFCIVHEGLKRLSDPIIQGKTINNMFVYKQDIVS